MKEMNKALLPSGNAQSNRLLLVYIYNFSIILRNKVLKLYNTKSLLSVDRKVVRENLYDRDT